MSDEKRGWMVGDGGVSAHACGRSGPEGLVISCLIQGVKTPCSLRRNPLLLPNAGLFLRRGFVGRVKGGGRLVGGGEMLHGV